MVQWTIKHPQGATMQRVEDYEREQAEARRRNQTIADGAAELGKGLLNNASSLIDLGLAVARSKYTIAAELAVAASQATAETVNGAAETVTELASSAGSAVAEASSAGLDAVLSAGGAVVEVGGSVVGGAADLAVGTLEVAGAVAGGAVEILGSLGDAL